MSARNRLAPAGAVPMSAVLLAAVLAAGAARADGPVVVGQTNRAFDRPEVTVAAGSTVRFVNNDEFGHQVYSTGPGFSFDTDETDPGGHADVLFPKPGHYTVLCHIHPKMRMDVDVR